jgi:hypothetical protein
MLVVKSCPPIAKGDAGSAHSDITRSGFAYSIGQLFGAPVIQGRTLSAKEDLPHGQRVAVTVVDTSNDLSGTGNNRLTLSGVGNDDHWNYYRTFADFNPGSTNGIPFYEWEQPNTHWPLSLSKGFA